jgi:protein-arginine kinase activator protein McsA
VRCARCHAAAATVHVTELRARLQRDFCRRCAVDAGFVSEGSGSDLTSEMLRDLEALERPILELRARIEAELRETDRE